jgi:hypothetical protein
MSITSTRTIQVGFSGVVDSQIIQSALENTVSPGELEIITLAIGNNHVLPPSISGIVITGLTILPPSGNVSLITLKGNDVGDDGIPLHLTDPVSLSLDTTFTGLYLQTPTEIIGVRLIWS